ncbi:MAG: NAD(P)H-dependent glycerol-3-phosphate dehydrogenase [Planctomycetota bacterium]|jgi:glycerol-3-phosphate dehydrogenase (NAD(P)+)
MMRIAVIGAGAWGTTMAIHLADQGHDVVLWARDADRAARMEEARENERYLKSFRFPDSMHVTAGAIGEAEFLVGGVPTQHMRDTYTRLKSGLPRVPFVSLSKGIELGTGRLPTQIFADVMGAGSATAVLTGPCIAREVALKEPTAAVVAGDEAAMFQEAFNGPTFRVYTSEDRLGAELGGALKNIMGIAAGIVDGMGLGDNTKATLLTRGIVEMARLGLALGAQLSTFNGLAGFGDLFTTCVSPYGRNRGLGERIGRGDTLQQVLDETQSVVEGVPTTKAVLELAREHGCEMPITEALYATLFEGVPAAASITRLMTRDPRRESAN